MSKLEKENVVTGLRVYNKKITHTMNNPFESIESAQEYVRLLAEAVTEAKQELEADVEKALTADVPRRLQVLRMALYDLEKLQLHMNTSHRILDELRSLHHDVIHAALPPVRRRPQTACRVCGQTVFCRPVRRRRDSPTTGPMWPHRREPDGPDPL